jgi:outer membrane immunogenic protein
VAKTTNLLIGWTAGGGMEFALTPHWSAKAEYMYYDLGSASYTIDTTGFGVVDAKTTGNTVRVGVNYHFNH